MKPPARVRVGFVSLGCAKNLVDSQIMAGSLMAQGMELASSPEHADIVVVNTCSFIADARDESTQAIRDACMLKRDGRCRGVIVCGCLSQRYRDSLAARMPDVDAFIGVDELDELPRIARRVAAGESGIINVSASPTRLFDPLPGHRVILSRGPYAYLKIAEGCNHGCAFCAIPGIRGRYRSRPVASIVREAASLLDAGFRELNLISQDTFSYGRDLGDGATLVRLLRELDGIGGDFWMRLLYGYPTGVTDELLDTMGSLPRICRYLDVPVQHRDPRILEAMRRGGTLKALPALVSRIRSVLPGAAIRTTCLVGFPGETETEFENLASFVREMEFDHLGVFVFSPEEGTPAFDMAGAVPSPVAEARRVKLLEMQRDVVDRRQAALVGKQADLLVERAGKARKTVCGRTRRLAPEVDGEVLVRNAGENVKPGSFLSVRYTAADGYDMEAVPMAGIGGERE